MGNNVDKTPTKANDTGTESLEEDYPFHRHEFLPIRCSRDTNDQLQEGIGYGSLEYFRAFMKNLQSRWLSNPNPPLILSEPEQREDMPWLDWEFQYPHSYPQDGHIMAIERPDMSISVVIQQRQRGAPNPGLFRRTVNRIREEMMEWGYTTAEIPKPTPGAPLEEWFGYYDVIKDRYKRRITLEDIAKDAGFHPDHVRHEHAKYAKTHGRSNRNETHPKHT